MSGARDVEALVDSLAALLAGRSAQIQGAALADLLATFLAGHIVPGDAAATDAVRERILAVHVDVVRKLVPVNEATFFADRG